MSGLGCGRPVWLGRHWAAAHEVIILYAGKALAWFFRCCSRDSHLWGVCFERAGRLGWQRPLWSDTPAQGIEREGLAGCGLEQMLVFRASFEVGHMRKERGRREHSHQARGLQETTVILLVPLAFTGWWERDLQYPAPCSGTCSPKSESHGSLVFGDKE